MSDYTKLVEALRCCDKYALCNDCPIFETCDGDVDKAMAIAAAAIEELQAQLPKRGEWIEHGEPPMLVIECSVCGQKYFNHALQEKAKYCSMCGAKMEVQE